MDPANTRMPEQNLMGPHRCSVVSERLTLELGISAALDHKSSREAGFLFKIRCIALHVGFVLDPYEAATHQFGTPPPI